MAGNIITGDGMEWYKSLALPSWTPSGITITIVWVTIYILTTISALLVWNNKENKPALFAMLIFSVNAFLNIFWSYLFFGIHAIYQSIIDAGLLSFSVLVLIAIAWPISRLAAMLLFPYLFWTAFAAYLNYALWILNS